MAIQQSILNFSENARKQKLLVICEESEKDYSMMRHDKTYAYPFGSKPHECTNLVNDLLRIEFIPKKLN